MSVRRRLVLELSSGVEQNQPENKKKSPVSTPTKLRTLGRFFQEPYERWVVSQKPVELWVVFREPKELRVFFQEPQELCEVFQEPGEFWVGFQEPEELELVFQKPEEHWAVDGVAGSSGRQD